MTPRKITAMLFPSDDSDIDTGNEDDDEEVINLSAIARDHIPHEWKDDTDDDPDYHSTNSSSDDTNKPSNSAKVNLCQNMIKNFDLSSYENFVYKLNLN